MDKKRLPRWILERNIIGNRSIGNARRRWVNAVEIESRVILKVGN
jgi:hypothetical protein